MNASKDTAAKILLLGDELSRHRRLIADLAANTRLAVQTGKKPNGEFSPSEIADIDLIVLEVTEAVSASLGLLRRIKQQLPAVKIIVVNNGQSTELAAQAFRYGAVDFFPKPLDIKLLTERIFYLVAAN